MPEECNVKETEEEADALPLMPDGALEMCEETPTSTKGPKTTTKVSPRKTTKKVVTRTPQELLEFNVKPDKMTEKEKTGLIGFLLTELASTNRKVAEYRMQSETSYAKARGAEDQVARLKIAYDKQIAAIAQNFAVCTNNINMIINGGM